ncbi:hypothetical protein SAMN05216351_11864 [Pseudobutyrivibrio sp. JW11]|uniref:hypothetical protein n=1 Tax=Pseudobutyrivibrio sp. JW11 TaxID=1855302 RepID=UPI0008E81109|nr:hypothetical protein [Pseudobutyrivibrio sp. JW11]SFO60749.1 hypothetical protein SAMN05216351_11864 [Pseudobutyrivibrio sp. JW11]
MGTTAEQEEAARRAAIMAAIAALKIELVGVNTAIKYYEAILSILQNEDSSLAFIKKDLTTFVYDYVSSYDLKGDTPWGGNKKNSAVTDLMTAKAEKTLYISDTDSLSSNIDSAIETTNEKLTELYSKRDDLEDKIADLESQL